MSNPGSSAPSSAINVTSIRSTSPPEKMKSAILTNSNSGWSPLRINKSSDGSSKTPGRKIVHQTPVRRTSSSFSHVRNNNLVSNSPFKLTSPSTSSSSLTPKVPSRIPTATRRVSVERRASLERRKKAIFPDGENTRPDENDRVPVLHRRQSRGLTTLERAEYVSKSPFRNSVSEPVISSSSEPSLEDDHEIESELKDLDDVLNTPRSSSTHVVDKSIPFSTPRPDRFSSRSAPSEIAAPRSNLVSKRLHGPRSTSGSTRRSRSKTVTFDERCDVVEFDVESFEQEEDVFQSDYEVDYDPNGPRRLHEEDGYDSNPSDHDDSYMSDPEGERGFVSSLLVQDEHNAYGDHSPRLSISPRPSTPPSQSAMPPNEGSEDDVPSGRSHHIDRLKAARSSSPARPPLTPIRDSTFDDRPPSPSPARALPHPPFSLPDVIDDKTEPSQGLGRQRAPLAPLILSPSKGRPTEPATANDPFALPSRAPLTTNSSHSAARGPADELRRSESPVRRGSPLTGAPSSNSLESSGSASRSSPRITRDEVRRRLLRSRTSPVDGEEICNPGDEDEEPSAHNTPTHEPDEPMSGSSPALPHRPLSVDLHQPGVDLGDVRSALDRLMIGVERGFNDDVSSIGGSRDVSFADDTANSSLVVDNNGRNSGVDEEHSVFISSHIQQIPAISPPSPLLSASKQMSAPPADADGSSPEHKRASSQASTTTEDTEEENGPRTPSAQFVDSAAITAPEHSIEPSEVQSPFTQQGKYAGLGLEARFPDKNKALPATPKPRISLDLPLTSTFHESEFENFASALIRSEDDPNKCVPTIEVIQAEPTQTTSKPALSGKEAIKAHEDAIIARRRALRREEYVDDSRQERPQRRRSRSAGDALDRYERTAADRSVARGNTLKAPISQDHGPPEPSLSASISKELDSLHGSKDRTYLLRERPETIYAAYDHKVNHHGLAGDVDSGKAWRTVRRPSDMNEYAKEIKDYRAREGAGKAHGKVFVKVLGVQHLGVPIPRLPTWFTCTLNNGIHFVTTPECRLEQNSAIDQEFELIEHNKLEFTLTLKVRRDKHLLPQVPVRMPRPPLPMPVTAPLPQKEKTKEKTGGFRAFLSGSPKKSKPAKASTPPPQPVPPPPPPAAPTLPDEPLVKYLKPDGTLGRVFLCFKDIASHCDTQLYETSLDLVSGLDDRSGNGPRKIGEMVIQMFRLPPLPGTPPDQLPQSLEECMRGMRHINWHKITYHEGILTQIGGDCKSWRRRQFRVIGAKLVAFNDVTKRATATIELRKVVAVHDDNDPESDRPLRRRTSDTYDAIFRVERSFRLVFADGEEIEFFADTDEDKAKWLQIFRAVLGRIPPNPLWAELVWQRQQDLALSSTLTPQGHR